MQQYGPYPPNAHYQGPSQGPYALSNQFAQHPIGHPQHGQPPYPMQPSGQQVNVQQNQARPALLPPLVATPVPPANVPNTQPSSVAQNPSPPQPASGPNIDHTVARECTQFDELLEFDPEWEESVFEKHVYPKSVAILTPVSLDYCQLPQLCTTDRRELISKYVTPNNVDTFTLPIEETIHWETISHDPAIAPIDYDHLLVPLEDMERYFRERQEWYRQTEDERYVDRPYRPTSSSGAGDDRDNEYCLGSYNSHPDDDGRAPVPDHQEDVFMKPRAVRGSDSRSRSHTPLHSRNPTPIPDVYLGPAFHHSSREPSATPSLGEDAEARLAALGVTGVPKSVIPRGGSVCGGSSTPPIRPNSRAASIEKPEYVRLVLTFSNPC